MLIADIIDELEQLAPPSLQESYDNAGLITGLPSAECTGVICTLDVTEEVIAEAIASSCNLVVAHHPIVFRGLKRINGTDYVQRVVISAIKNDIAIYAIHTNLDHIAGGVNRRIAGMLGLEETRILDPKPDILRKLVCFVPDGYVDQVRDALFAAGAGKIGRYDECSFGSEGTGTFMPLEGATPFLGTTGKRELARETKLEVVLSAAVERLVVNAMREAHPYEEVAFDVIPLANQHPEIGAGMIGRLPAALEENDFLTLLKQRFKTGVIRHTALLGRSISRVAVCGGAGSFLISKALNSGVDAFVTSDLKYHEFFDADGRMLLADIGHFESEQYTTDLLQEVLLKKFPTFAVLKTAVISNPVRYFK